MMKLFLKKISLFLLPIIVLAYPIDAFISHFLKQSNAYYGEFEVWNDIYDGAINADLLIYGSSRAWVNVDTELLESELELTAYNLGINGHNFWMQYLRHLEYISHNSWPKKIVLAVDIHSLQKREELYLYQQFLPFALWNDNVEHYTSSYRGFTKLDYKIPMLRYIGEEDALKEAFSYAFNDSSAKQQKFRTKGFRSRDKEWSTALDDARQSMEKYYVKIDTSSVELLNKFLTECNKKNTEVIFVYTPEYYEGQQFIANRDKVVALLKKTASNYNLKWLDYSNANICSDTSYFYNATHLNKKGAALFSMTLAEDLKKTTNR